MKISIPQLDELLYTMKLKNGEELLFTLIEEHDHGLTIDAPIKVSLYNYITDTGNLVTEVLTQKWLLFAKHSICFIDLKDIAVYTKMHQDSYSLYIDALEKYTSKDSFDVSSLMEQPIAMQ